MIAAVDDTTLTYGTDYVVANRQVTFSPAPAAGSLIVIQRQTSTERLVSWQDASVLKAEDMTISQVQQLHILEEQEDWIRINSMVTDENNRWNASNHRIINVGDPVDEGDAVNIRYINSTRAGYLSEMRVVRDEVKGYVDEAKTSKTDAASSASSALDSKTSAAASAKAASESATAAANSAKGLTAAEASAKASAESALASKNSADASAIAAGQSATSAGTSASTASAAATASNQSASNASGSATLAANSAITADSAKTSATNSATAAATSATNAKNSETNSATSAASAAPSKTEAANSATAAKASETAAAASKTAAESSKTAAKTSETNAASSATSAQTSATTATTKANTATSEANRAKAEADRAEAAAITATAGGVKSVNGISPDATGNVTIEVGGGTTDVHWDNIQDKPAFAAVAFDGNYASLNSTPDLSKYLTTANAATLYGSRTGSNSWSGTNTYTKAPVFNYSTWTDFTKTPLKVQSVVYKTRTATNTTTIGWDSVDQSSGSVEVLIDSSSQKTLIVSPYQNTLGYHGELLVSVRITKTSSGSLSIVSNSAAPVIYTSGSAPTLEVGETLVLLLQLVSNDSYADSYTLVHEIAKVPMPI